MQKDAATRLALKTRISPTGCLEYTGSVSKRDGYGWFMGAGERKAHRAAYAIHRGPIPEGAWVLHTCDNRICVLPAHLYLGDHAANIRDMVERGRSRGAHGDRNGMRTHPEKTRHGTKNPHARLTDALVLEMREARSQGSTLQELEDRFGVTKATAGRVVTWKIWKHVEGPRATPEVLSAIRKAGAQKTLVTRGY